MFLMKIIYLKILICIFLSICFLPKIKGQNITITDTVRPDPYHLNLKIDSVFIVEGEVSGIDSGSIKVYSKDKSVLVYIPFRLGKFYFSGFTKSLEQLHFLINGDYYDNAFYVQPGEIRIKYIYQSKFTASGTTENDLGNYFRDTLNYKNSTRFWELSNKIELASKNEDLELYLNLIDSFTITEKALLKTVNEAIDQKMFGDYLLAYVNYYYINHGYFDERKSIYERLPENIKNSISGRQAFIFLNETKRKNLPTKNTPAFQFSLKDINSKIVSFTEFKGKTIVLDFWASWCLPCIKALPLLKKIHSNEVSNNIVYISISIDKKENDWRGRENILSIPWYSLIADSATIKQYEVDAVPTYIVIDNQGTIVSKNYSLGKLYTTLKTINK